jgi:hypothetical protein
MERSSNSRGWRRSSIRLLFGVSLIVLGVVLEWVASTRQGADFASLQLMGSAIREGSPVYDLEWQRAAFPARFFGLTAPLGMFYPPATGFAMLPFSLLPYRLGLIVWFLTLALSLILGTRVLLRSSNASLGHEVWTIAAGSVLLSACARWGLTPLQGAPLLCGLLAWFVVSLQRRHARTACAIAAYATIFKVTMALPFLALLLLHRRYLALGLIGVLWISLNAMGFARVGGAEALHAYQSNVSLLEAVDQLNTPDPFRPVSVPRTDWIYLFYGMFGSVQLARVLAMAASALVSLRLLAIALRMKERPTLAQSAAFLAPLVCLTLLCVYHHHYDLCLVIPSLLMVFIGPAELRPTMPARWLLAPLTALMALMPVATAHRIVHEHFGTVGLGLLNLAFPLATTAALLGFFAVLETTVPAPHSARAALTAPRPTTPSSFEV